MTFEHMGKTIELRGGPERSGTGKLAPQIGVATRDFVAWSDGDPVDRMVMVRWKIGEGWSPLLGDTLNVAKQAMRRAAAHHLNKLQTHDSASR